MKLPCRSARSRAQLSEKLLAYSTASTATLGAASIAAALSVTPTVSAHPLPPGATSIDATYFGGSLPEIHFARTANADFYTSPGAYAAFYVEGAPLVFIGAHSYSSPSSFNGFLGIFRPDPSVLFALNGVPLPSGGPFFGFFTSYNGSIGLNAFTHGAGATSSHYADLSFATNAGLYGILRLQLGFDGSGNISLGLTSSGSYFVSPVPEPATIAAGLGLLALGYAGIREHRRRRATAKKPAPVCAG